jgi:hypothetical protein
VRILQPIDIVLTSTTVPETDYPEWAVGTTYALGDRVIVAAEHNVYESLANTNLGNTPSTATDKWVLVGKTNAYKLLDDRVNTQTTSATQIVMEFPVGKATSLAFFNVECNSLTVEVWDGATLVSTETKVGMTRSTAGWYSYFFGSPSFAPFFLFEHVYNPNATYKVIVDGNLIKIGVMVKGTLESLGETQWGAELGFYDYSKKDTDQWGETYLAQGAYRDYFRGEIATQTGQLQVVRKILRDRRGKLSLFVPTDAYDMVVYGFAREPSLVWQNTKISIWSIDIEGVI